MVSEKNYRNCRELILFQSDQKRIKNEVSEKEKNKYHI